MSGENNFKPMDYIDGIFYINLDKRADRRYEIEEELNKMELPFERFTAIETPGRGILGCGYSHLSVFKMAKERKYRNVLIFEDDFYFLISISSKNIEKFDFPFFLLIFHKIDKIFSSYRLKKFK